MAKTLTALTVCVCVCYWFRLVDVSETSSTLRIKMQPTSARAVRVMKRPIMFSHIRVSLCSGCQHSVHIATESCLSPALYAKQAMR